MRRLSIVRRDTPHASDRSMVMRRDATYCSLMACFLLVGPPRSGCYTGVRPPLHLASYHIRSRETRGISCFHSCFVKSDTAPAAHPWPQAPGTSSRTPLGSVQDRRPELKLAVVKARAPQVPWGHPALRHDVVLIWLWHPLGEARPAIRQVGAADLAPRAFYKARHARMAVAHAAVVMEAAARMRGFVGRRLGRRPIDDDRER